MGGEEERKGKKRRKQIDRGATEGKWGGEMTGVLGCHARGGSPTTGTRQEDVALERVPAVPKGSPPREAGRRDGLGVPEPWHVGTTEGGFRSPPTALGTLHPAPRHASGADDGGRCSAAFAICGQAGQCASHGHAGPRKATSTWERRPATLARARRRGSRR